MIIVNSLRKECRCLLISNNDVLYWLLSALEGLEFVVEIRGEEQFCRLESVAIFKHSRLCRTLIPIEALRCLHAGDLCRQLVVVPRSIGSNSTHQSWVVL